MGGSRHRHDLGASQSDLGPSQIDLGASQSDLGPRQIDLCVSHFVYHLSLSLLQKRNYHIFQKLMFLIVVCAWIIIFYSVKLRSYRYQLKC